jgi:hypothetical protein
MSKTQSHNNKFVIAAAGSGKTTRLVEDALAIKDKKILITTFTDENFSQINEYIIERNGFVPENITVLTWYSFLIQHGVRPYQNFVIDNKRVLSLYFDVTPPAAKYTPKTNTLQYYLTESGLIYRDRVAEFICQSNEVSGGLVIGRLEKIFDCIFIDEVQDLSGYDLNFLEALLRSTMNVVGVGDLRQATFSTNHSRKNKKYKKTQIIDWIKEKEQKGLVVIEPLSDCHRCNQTICDYADKLFPDLPQSISKNDTVTGHDGVFFITEAEVHDYYEKYQPVMVLRNNKNSNTLGLPAINIGVSKGRTYARVLVFPTQPMKKYFNDNDHTALKDKARLYVAITRARFSVTFVI